MSLREMFFFFLFTYLHFLIGCGACYFLLDYVVCGNG